MFRPVIRLQDQAELLTDYVREGDSILDVGCGTGYLSKYLEEMYAVKPTGLDVKDVREQPITFYSLDGASIPFPARTFDCVLLSYSLHHAHDPEQLIRECHRVARRTIIVFEDLPHHLFSRLMLSIHVSIFAARYPSKPARSPHYREALKWLGDHVIHVTQIAIPPKWLHRLYPRFLLVYTLSND
jgi:ubiquinone/menaquinone biosynthesis C-methylase UbiE